MSSRKRMRSDLDDDMSTVARDEESTSQCVFHQERVFS